jgi:Ribbon-helix-helix protein, copG family
MPRTSLRDRLQGGSVQPPQGREALYQTAPAAPVQYEVDRPPSTVNGGRDVDEESRWEDSHTRVTFYCPVALLASVDEEVASSPRSKSQIIVDALREHMGPRKGRRD